MIIKGCGGVEDVGGMIENEGPDYFFMDYLALDQIEDELLQESVRGWRDQRADAIKRLEDLGVLL